MCPAGLYSFYLLVSGLSDKAAPRNCSTINTVRSDPSNKLLRVHRALTYVYIYIYVPGVIYCATSKNTRREKVRRLPGYPSWSFKTLLTILTFTGTSTLTTHSIAILRSFKPLPHPLLHAISKKKKEKKLDLHNDTPVVTDHAKYRAVAHYKDP